MDLGVLLARRHAGLLILSWALPALPLLALLSLLLWDSPGWVLLIFWWLKPLGERLPLFILSRLLFGKTPGLGESLRALPGLLRLEWLSSLTRRRFSLSRSFDLPVLLLEGLGGRDLQQRRAILATGGKRGAGWLTVVGLHLELALWLGLLAFLYLLLPAQAGSGLDWQNLLDGQTADWLWLEHLSNLLYALVLMVWEPLYVACGFALYLNRRIHLEAWDLELAFRRLRHRLSGTVGILLLAAGLVLASPDPAMAQAQARELDRQTARADIRMLLGKPPFHQREERLRWRFGEPPKADASGPSQAPPEFAEPLARALKILLWTLLAAGSAVLAWRYRDWLMAFSGRETPPVRPAPAPITRSLAKPEPPAQSADIAAEAERLWDEHPDQALSLLYHALLVRLREDFRLPLSDADTEGEVLRRIRRLEQAELLCLAERLTLHWQNLAYGRQLPPAGSRAPLLAAWRRLFGREDRT